MTNCWSKLMHNWCVEFQFWRMNLHHELKQDCFFEGINCFCVCIYLFIFGLIIVTLYIKNVSFSIVY